MAENSDALEFLIKNCPMLNLSERNQAGETAYSLAQEKKHEKILKLLDWYQQHLGDQTQQQTDALLNDLLEEEQKEE